MNSPRELAPLFDPKSIAVVGASADPAKVSSRPLKFLLEHGYQGRIYPINPKATEIMGLKCYPSLRAVPEEIDLVSIIVPAQAVVRVLEDCAAKGVKAVSIITSGFAELGPQGRALQERIREIARQHNIALSGPNSVGMHNFKTKAIASISQLFERKDLLVGPIAFISQSGAFGTAICALAQAEKIGFTYFVSSGNEADLELADYIDYVVDDPQIKVISGYVEGIKDGSKFMAAADRALEAGKPIIMVKVGRFGAGARAASSHTGSMAGSDQVYGAAFKQTGAIRAFDVQELLDYSSIFALGQIHHGENVAIISTSGGAGVLMADKCEELGLTVKELGESTKAELLKILPAFSAVGNPVDVTGQFLSMPGAIKGCIEILDRDEQVDVIILFLALVWSQWEQIANDISNVARNTGKPVVVCWVGAPQGALDILRANGVVNYPEPVRCVKGVHALLSYGRMRERILEGRSKEKEPSEILAAAEMERIKDRLSDIRRAGRTMLTEKESKDILQAYGIPVTREKLAQDADQAVTLAEEIGWPVAMKVSSPDIPHKTEAKAIALNLTGPDQVRAAFGEIWQNAWSYNKKAVIDGILVQEMLKPGTEVIVGMSKDPQFGPVLMFGLGGVLVEIMRDVSLRICPISPFDAEAMINETKGAKLLQGFRGGAPADLDTIKEILLRMSRLALDLRDYVSEIDINPLVVYEKNFGAKAGDALISLL
jgi:acetyltransferase